MRRVRLARLFPPLGLLAFAVWMLGCQGNQQGYYGPCDEPAGFALNCPAGVDDGLVFAPWEGCMKLATCGVILPQEDEEDAGVDQPPAFDRCVAELARAEQDLGDVVLECIQHASCPDLAATIDDQDDPDSQNGNIEGVIGWCGRLDPR